MHYNMVNVLPGEDGRWIVHESDSWLLAEHDAIDGLPELYANIGFKTDFYTARDGTELIVMFNQDRGWRVCQLR